MTVHDSCFETSFFRWAHSVAETFLNTLPDRFSCFLACWVFLHCFSFLQQQENSRRLLVALAQANKNYALYTIKGGSQCLPQMQGAWQKCAGFSGE